MNRVEHILKNIRSTIFTQIPLFFSSFIVRWVFIKILGEQYLGLSGLFSNILTLLSVAELGFGTSITYSLYRPLAIDNREKIKSLMQLFRRAYTVIGILIIIVGISLTPNLEFFIREMPEGIAHIRLIYVLYVLDSGVSYFFSYKASLLFADQKKYVETCIRTCVKLACQGIQLILLVVFKNYILYILCQVISSLVTNLWISISANRAYPYLLEKNIQPLSESDKNVIKKNVGAMVFHRFGAVAVFGTDNILMAKFISLASVGLYSNYVMITDALNRIISRFYQDIMASMGNVNVVENGEKKIRAFNNQFFFSAWIFGFCAICLIHLYNPFISIWLGKEFIFPWKTVAVIVINFYLYNMKMPVNNTKDVMGLFWYNRYAPLIEVPLNFIISIMLSKPLGILGILLGTLISTLLVPFWLEPVILYRFGLGISPHAYFIRFGVYTLVTVFAGTITGLFCNQLPVGLIAFIFRMFICFVVPNVIFWVIYRQTEEFKYIYRIVIGMKNKIVNKIQYSDKEEG